MTLTQKIQSLAKDLSFNDCGITSPTIDLAGQRLSQWLEKDYHGKMAYMARYGNMRFTPSELMPETRSIIMVRMDYLCEDPQFNEALDTPDTAYVSRYAQNRDYHKILRKRLQKLANQITKITGKFDYRATTDSAPIMEKPLAEQAGLGWIGKSTNLIHPKSGSYFFLGALLTSLDLEPSTPMTQSHCGSCTRCIDVCPTQAIVAPYQLDARRCISYLTIELKEDIPEEFRKPIGNRIYGCDDCQTCCPWNKFAKPTQELGFQSLRGLKTPDLLELFLWDEATFLSKTEGSAIRRIGHTQWLRNIAVALGNAPHSDKIIRALECRSEHPSDMLKRHIQWALTKQLKSPHLPN